MPQFFFHFSDAGEIENDEIGVEFDSVEQAYLEAVATARSLWPELLSARRDPSRCAFEITNAEGAVLFHLPFSELLEGDREPALSRPVTIELHKRLTETHARAQLAREDVRRGITQAHASLRDITNLMAQISAYGERSAARK